MGQLNNSKSLSNYISEVNKNLKEELRRESIQKSTYLTDFRKILKSRYYITPLKVLKPEAKKPIKYVYGKVSKTSFSN